METTPHPFPLSDSDGELSNEALATLEAGALPDYQRVLMHPLGFTVDDLAANRLGALTHVQRNRLRWQEYRGWVYFLIACLVVLAPIMRATGPDTAPGLASLPMLMFWTMLVILALLFLSTASFNGIPMKGEPIHSVEWKCAPDRKFYRVSSGKLAPQDQFEVRGKTLQEFLHVIQGDKDCAYVYRIYFYSSDTYRLRRLLSVEILDIGEA